MKPFILRFLSASSVFLFVLTFSPAATASLDPPPGDQPIEESQADFMKRVRDVRVHDFDSLSKAEALNKLDASIAEVSTMIATMKAIEAEAHTWKRAGLIARLSGFLTSTVSMAGTAIVATGGYRCHNCIPRILGIVLAAGGTNFYVFFIKMSPAERVQLVGELEDLKSRYLVFREIIALRTDRCGDVLPEETTQSPPQQ